MSIGKKITQEHDELKSALKGLDKTTVGDAQMRESVYPKTFERIDAHFRAEEGTIYSAMLNDSDTRERALREIEEHRVARDLMRQLNDISADSEEWVPRIAVINDFINRHFSIEESEVLPDLGSKFESDQVDSWSDKFDEIESKIKGMTPR